ncbi:MAG: glycosyltransferase family 2 protein [Paludibacteraceae bacterium]|nr:glycosyltransferase family 2 protein [Paludibacteraceae bacterium]
MSQMDLSVSLVVYNNDASVLSRTIFSVLQSKDISFRIYVVDNSPNQDLKQLCTDSRIEYIYNNANIGFGSGHNVVINGNYEKGRYHLVLNPDIYFQPDVLKRSIDFLDENYQYGLMMPAIKNPNGTFRYVRRRLPGVYDVFTKIILPHLSYTKKRDTLYRTKDFSYERVVENIPFISGCFLLFRTEVLIAVHGFDPRYFMYFEDADLCRRALQKAKNVYNPAISVVHTANQESHHSLRLFKIHLRSAVQYFHKWGWFFDKERTLLNKNIKQQ